MLFLLPFFFSPTSQDHHILMSFIYTKLGKTTPKWKKERESKQSFLKKLCLSSLEQNREMILIFFSLFDYLKSPIFENQCQYLLWSNLQKYIRCPKFKRNSSGVTPKLRILCLIILVSDRFATRFAPGLISHMCHISEALTSIRIHQEVSLPTAGSL